MEIITSILKIRLRNRIYAIPWVVHYLQFRFVHKILGTDQFLNRINKYGTALCSFCGRFVENIRTSFFLDIFLLDIESDIFGRTVFFTKQDHLFRYCLKQKHLYNFLVFNINQFLFRKTSLSSDYLLKSFYTNIKSRENHFSKQGTYNVGGINTFL